MIRRERKLIKVCCCCCFLIDMFRNVFRDMFWLFFFGKNIWKYSYIFVMSMFVIYNFKLMFSFTFDMKNKKFASPINLQLWFFFDIIKLLFFLNSDNVHIQIIQYHKCILLTKNCTYVTVPRKFIPQFWGL